MGQKALVLVGVAAAAAGAQGRQRFDQRQP
jgi:hypothetical protein